MATSEKRIRRLETWCSVLSLLLGFFLYCDYTDDRYRRLQDSCDDNREAIHFIERALDTREWERDRDQPAAAPQ
jgi:hypothetical protein